MEINVRIRENNSQRAENVLAFASATLNGVFAIHDIAIIRGKEGKPFVSMPSYVKTAEDGSKEYQDICYPKKDFYETFMNAVMEAYNNVIANRGERTEEQTKDDKKPEALDTSFSVRVTPYEAENSNIKGYATVTLNEEFIVSRITLVEGKKGVFVAMPSSKWQDSNGEIQYSDICHPVTKEFREQLYKGITDAYVVAKEKGESKDENPIVEPEKKPETQKEEAKKEAEPAPEKKSKGKKK